jgi:hypothetical protein
LRRHPDTFAESLREKFDLLTVLLLSDDKDSTS